MTWTQNYNPAGHWLLSTLLAAIPVLILLSALAIFRIKAHFAALMGLTASLLIACSIFGMPLKMGMMSAVYGILYGLFPIGWIVLNVIFMYDLTCEAGHFKVLQQSLMGITQDRRLQLVLIAFAFGAFFEGACGFGTPVAVTAAILIGIGFKPLQASGLSLIANTAPVAFGALGTPLIALSGVSGLNLLQLSGMTGRILPFFSLLVPFWLIWTFAGFDGMIEVWPATLVAGLFFAIPQFLISNLHGPWLVDVVASVCSIAGVTALLLFWHPKRIWGLEGHEADRSARGEHGHARSAVDKSVDALGHPQRHRFCLGTCLPQRHFSIIVSSPKIPIAYLHNLIAASSSCSRKADSGTRDFPAELALRVRNRNSFLRDHLRISDGLQPDSSRSPIRENAVSSALFTDHHCRDDGHRFHYALFRTRCDDGSRVRAHRNALSVLRNAARLARSCAHRFRHCLKRVYSAACSAFRRIKLACRLSLMCAANSAGGVMGKMIDAQSIVVASTATEWYGHEGDILRYVFLHSIALASLVGILVFLQAYVAIHSMVSLMHMPSSDCMQTAEAHRAFSFARLYIFASILSLFSREAE